MGAHKGEAHHKAKLTEAAVREMRRLREKEGVYIRVLAEKFDVAFITAWLVVNYETWKHVR